MDKADFVRLAPAYYELAVLLVVWERDGFFGEAEMEAPYIIENDEDRSDWTNLLHSQQLLNSAIKGLVAKGALEPMEDPFGPTLYKRGAGINTVIEELQEDPTSAFHKSSLAPDRNRWLKGALWKVYYTYRDLRIQEADFDAPEEEWAPLPIDRESEAFKKVEAAVDETIKEVEQSNGYASQHAEERESVLGNLKLLQGKLKTAKEISIGFVKTHGIPALKKLSLRFGNTTIGKVADVAIDALLTWLGLK